MAETFSERRAKLRRIASYVQDLIELNEQGARIESRMLANGDSTTEVGNTVNALFGGAGPPTALAVATADTLSDRAINLLNAAISGGVDWTYEASA